MKQFIVNLFGVVGYICLLLQWMWLAVTLVVPIAMHPSVADLFMPNTQPAPERTVEPRDPIPSAMQTTILILSILFSVGIIIYAIISVPKSIGKGGQKITQSVARRAVPVVTRHQPIDEKQQRTLVERITWLVKALAIVVPVALLAVPPGQVVEIDHTVSIVFGLIVAAGSIIAFCLQYIAVKIWDINSRFVW